MARDYAVRRAPPSRKKAGAMFPPWVWLFAGLSIGLAIAVITYISRPAVPMPGPKADPVISGSAAAPPQGSKVKVPPKEKPRFTFYELLPSQEIVIRDGDDEVPAPAVKKPEQAAANAYMILVASYRERGNAEEQKAQLAMLGMESRVEKVTIDNRDTFYRVRIGPESNLGRAQKILAQLSSHGIEGVLVKLK